MCRSWARWQPFVKWPSRYRATLGTRLHMALQLQLQLGRLVIGQRQRHLWPGGGRKLLTFARRYFQLFPFLIYINRCLSWSFGRCRTVQRANIYPAAIACLHITYVKTTVHRRSMRHSAAPTWIQWEWCNLLDDQPQCGQRDEQHARPIHRQLRLRLRRCLLFDLICAFVRCNINKVHKKQWKQR